MKKTELICAAQRNKVHAAFTKTHYGNLRVPQSSVFEVWRFWSDFNPAAPQSARSPVSQPHRTFS